MAGYKKEIQTEGRRIFLCIRRNGKKINSIRIAFENALKRAEIKNFHFHNLRHIFASYFFPSLRKEEKVSLKQ